MVYCDGCGRYLHEPKPRNSALLCMECYDEYRKQGIVIENLKLELCGRGRLTPKKEG